MDSTVGAQSRGWQPDMETLQTFYPNVDDLISTPPEDLAPLLLKFARGIVQNDGMFFPGVVNDIATGTNNLSRTNPGYPFHSKQKIDALLNQTWGWIERNGLITRAAGTNGRNGWMVFTQQGEKISDAQDFRKLQEAAAFPKSLIRAQAWIQSRETQCRIIEFTRVGRGDWSVDRPAR